MPWIQLRELDHLMNLDMIESPTPHTDRALWLGNPRVAGEIERLQREEATEAQLALRDVGKGNILCGTNVSTAAERHGHLGSRCRLNEAIVLINLKWVDTAVGKTIISHRNGVWSRFYEWKVIILSLVNIDLRPCKSATK